ncbi:Predicted PurR-regulated permease PerM [Desulfonispora thiosulfatigenes DSM 11270]|uniref:Predicted PurR-regulated permease PerM n=1 Tax=Desulfonispora thiosulfatigenes DSM 11270 TaxID=656914 RepID=A0A1W1VQJ9_DESTI|nr:AI-2E family transporter [Desulfonispora thiosulfatigenes]SMB95616.1 Predicted PurR-regulated permease PerM [Desulfonispora thiosulfatigenes DSM 11270]
MFKLNNKVIRIIVFAGLILGLAYFFKLIYPILTPFFLAIFLAYILKPLINFFELKGLSRTWAIIFIYFSFNIILTAIIFNFLPKVLAELTSFGETIPSYTLAAQEYIKVFQETYSKVPLPEGIRNITNDMINDIENYVINVIKGVTQTILLLFSKTFDFILAPILAFYLLNDTEKFKDYFLKLLPFSTRDDIVVLGRKIDSVLKSFIRGNIIIALMVGIITTIALILIDMDFALVIGLLTSVLNIIPYFGALFAIIIAVAIALLKSKKIALYVFIIMLIIQQIEGNVISPKVLGQNLGLHPLAVIFVLLAGGHLGGILGMILAVPITCILIILFKFFINKLIEL